MRHLAFRLQPGQDFKREIEARTRDVAAGVLLSVVGGLELAVLRMAGATADRQPVRAFQGPLEIVAGTGTVSRDGCHIHISASDDDGRVFGGHLKDGCIIKFTAEIVIGVLDDTEFRRERDETTGFPELVVVKGDANGG